MKQPMEQRPVDGRADPVSLGDALLAGKKVAPDVTALLIEDHRTVMGWFDGYASEDRLPAKATEEAKT
jgi:hypothetical protein